MYQTIAHRDDFYPRRPWHIAARRLGDPGCRFAHDLNILDRYKDELAVRVEVAACSSLQEGQRFTRSVEHVP
ncbi:MAG: hypothetical protein OXC26_08645 [Albidovulum sp.]|nr:hypothetical protein [Albidovulum sp.]